MNKYIRKKGCYQSPVNINIAVTEKCNLRCPICFQKFGRHDELPIQRLQGLLREIAVMGAGGVQFSGGEPLLYQHLVEAIRLAGELGLYCRISTSGVGMDHAYARSLKAAGLDCCHVSLNGSNKEIHEKTRSHYDETIRAIDILHRENVVCVINWVATHDNAYDFHNIIKLAESLGVQRIDVLMNKINNRDNLQSSCSYGDLLLLQQLCIDYPDFVNVENCFISLRVLTQGNRIPLIDKGCLAGRFHMAINARGEFMPCPHLDVHDTGNYTSISDYWENDSILHLLRTNFLAGNKIDSCKACKFLRYCNPCHIIVDGSVQRLPDMYDCVNIANKATDER